MQSVVCLFTLSDLRHFERYKEPTTNNTIFVVKGTSEKSFEGMFLRKIVRGLGYHIVREATYVRDGDECEITTTVPWSAVYS